MMIIYRRILYWQHTDVVTGDVFIADCNLDIDFNDSCSWIVPGTIDSDYNKL